MTERYRRKKKRMKDPKYRAKYRAAQLARTRRRKYGISQEVFDEMLADQGERCLICRRKRKLCVDHDHETGEVRGLLCQQCNIGLGAFGDNPRYLRRAIRYLMEG